MSRSLSGGIKLAAEQLNQATQNCDVRIGTVVKTKPLSIQITNLLTLPQSVLIVPQHLTDYKVSVSLDWETGTNGSHNHGYDGSTTSVSGGSGESSFASHSHSYSGTTDTNGGHSHSLQGNKTMTIKNALKVGDKVALIRKTGGQLYYILDRI